MKSALESRHLWELQVKEVIIQQNHYNTQLFDLSPKLNKGEEVQLEKMTIHSSKNNEHTFFCKCSMQQVKQLLRPWIHQTGTI